MFDGCDVRLVEVDGLVNAPSPLSSDRMTEALDTARRWLAVAGAARRTTLSTTLASLHLDTMADAAIGLLVRRGDALVLHADGEAWLVPAAPHVVTLAGAMAAVGCVPPDPGDRRTALVDELGPPSWHGRARTFAAVAADDHEDAPGWRMLAHRGIAEDLLHWPVGGAPVPHQLDRAAALFGHLAGAAREDALAELAAWAGLDAVATIDPSQDDVAQAPATARLVVEAGPGSGKTHTIAARVAALVAAGVSPARIHVISFTRNAVAEMTARLGAAGVAADLECSTLDQLAGRISGRFGQGGGGDGHDATVERALALIRDDDSRAAEWIGRREHLVVDEAQDVVGPRRDFVLALIARLAPGCGVTVACDPYQAIYGHHGQGDTLAERCLSLGFAVARLARNHRAGSPGLKSFVCGGRAVLASADAATVVAVMTELLHAAADGVPAVPQARGTQPFASLSLFRTGGAMAAYASRLAAEGIPYALRGGQGGVAAAPLGPAWIGAIAPALDGRDPAVLASALEVLAPLDPFAPAPDEAAAILAPALRNGRYTAAALAEALADGRLGTLEAPPGTLDLSTIHAAKGLEADSIAVFIPRPDSVSGERTDAFEEARILYVAGTRARRRLEVGVESVRWHRCGGRHVLRRGHSLLVELTARDAAGTRLCGGVDPVRLAGAPPRGPFRLTRRDGIWFVEATVGDEFRSIATLSEGFARDVQRAVEGAGTGAFPGSTAPYAGTLRVATVVQDGTVAVAPVLEGFARVFIVEGRT